MKKYFCFAVLMLSLGFVRAQVTLPFYDGFNYTAGENLAANGSWVSGSGSGTIKVNAANLSYSGLQASVGNDVSIIPGSSSARTYVNFTSQTSGTVYFSFLLKLNTAPSAQRLIAYAYSSTSSSSTPYLGIFATSGSQLAVGISTSTPQFTSSALTVGSTYLVVVAYTFGTSDSAEIWINPASLGGSAPATTGSFTATGTHNSSLAYFHWNTPSAGTGGGSYETDEARIGSTYAAVTPTDGPLVGAKLGFTTQPADALVGATINAVVVQVQTSGGASVASNNVPVTLALTSGSGALSGTLTQNTDSSGKATFGNLSIDTAGTGKQLTASASGIGVGLASATSSSFSITSSPPPTTTTNAPRFTHFAKMSQGFSCRGTNGTTNGVYTIVTSTNLSLPQDQWSVAGTNYFDASGNFIFTNTVVFDGRPHFFCLRVAGGSTNQSPVAPTITTQPTNQTVTAGNNATFNVAASGTAPLSYQWFFNSAAQSGATSSSLALSSVQSSNAGSYSVRVTNSVGSITSSIAVLTVNAPPTGNVFYVSTTGSDANPGTLAAPFATPQYALTVIASGDTIYLRGGTYNLSTQVKPTIAGMAGNYCELWAYPGELPVFDFSTTAAGTKGLYISQDYWHVKGIEVANATDNGIIVAGCGFGIVEACVVHDCNNDGIRLGSSTAVAHDTLILNCDSYRNFQASSGGNNGDGFASKNGTGTGNIFRGCRAWNNSDDGWDFYDNDVSITLENCWTYANGYDLWGVGAGFSGNGNGFKLGGAGTVAQHTLKNCLAIQNVHDGFDQNYNAGGVTIYNCTAYGNGVNFQFPDTPTVGVDVLKNNISYSGPVALNASAQLTSNSWQHFTVIAGDFAGLDGSTATNARNADFSLPDLALLHLASGSQLIDKGVDVGLPFSGSAPDLGAYEAEPPAPTPPSITTQPTNQTVNAGNNATFIASASGTAPLSYQWYFNTNTALANATSSSLTISSAQTTNAGNYSVRVTNVAGSVTSAIATLTVNVLPTAPSITNQPQSQTITISNAVTFTVSASGTAPLKYQWYFNTNTPLASATNSSFTISSVTSNDAGGYSVIVTNTVGSATSSIATLTVTAPTTNGDYFVATNGSDSNPGTFAAPFATVGKAISVATAGKLIYVRGGTYFHSVTINITNSGTAGNLIKLWAYPGETPLLDFTNQPYGSANRGFVLKTNGNYWHFKGLEIARAGDNAIKVESSHCIFELLVLHHNGDSGLQIGFAHETSNPGANLAAFIQVINCDSYLNYDSDSNGGDADGFAAKLHCGQGIIFTGCRAWLNSDDGWDLFETDASVIISNCWTWKSGVAQGNGNGFKLGGNGTGGDSAGTHYAYNCVAFGCKVNGFTQNSHKDGVVVINSLSYSNGSSGYNYFMEGNLNSGKQNVFKNNISLPRTGSNGGGFIEDNTPLEQNNSWNLAVTVNAADFSGFNEAAALAPRNADGSLPTGFARLFGGSDLIDQGVDVGIPFNGTAPDLGAFESP